MRLLASALVWLTLLLAPSLAQSPVMNGFPPGTFQSRAAIDANGTVTYSGPGDALTGWQAAWGLQAFKSSTRGNKQINLCNIADATCSDVSSSASTGALTGFSTVGGAACSVAITAGTYNSTTGAVVLTTVSGSGLSSGNIGAVSGLTGTGAFAGLNYSAFLATTGTTGTTVAYTAPTGLGTAAITGGTLSMCTVKILYDLTTVAACSGACDQTQSTINGRPVLAFNCINTSLPCMLTLRSNTPFMNSPFLASSIAQPLTLSVVSYVPGSTESGIMGGNASGAELINNNSVGNTANIYANGGGTVDATAANAVWHSFQGIFNGSSSFPCIDGACASSGNPGTAGLNSGQVIILFSGVFSDSLTGGIEEAGVLTPNITSGNASTLCHNQFVRLGIGAC